MFLFTNKLQYTFGLVFIKGTDAKKELEPKESCLHRIAMIPLIKHKMYVFVIFIEDAT